MRIKLIAFFVVLNLFGAVLAQENETKKIDIYGFVRADLFGDTYKGLNAAKDQFYLLPLYGGKDANGEDINEQFSSNLVTMATRVGLRYKGPEIYGAKTVANIEGDFAGNPSTFTAVVRIRQANVKFNWANSTLTVGQTWHPLWSGKIYPTVGSLNTGAPFQPFNRSPQIRYDYNVGMFTLSGAGIYEFQYVTSGPLGKSDQYLRNSGIPELFAGAEVRKDAFTLGAGFSYKLIKPMFTTVNNFKSTSLLQSSIIMGYAQYKNDKLTIKAKSVVGQNTSYLLMPGGFGVYSKDDITGEYLYTNYNNSNSFINVVYGKSWQLGVFGGYMLNLGTTDALINTGSTENPDYLTWGMLPSMQSMYRFAPHVAHNVGNARFVLEFEHTMAEYGTEGTINPNDGLYMASNKATNNRILFMFMYTF